MARNQIKKHVNELNIRKVDYLKKQQEEYKFARLKKSLDILNRASYYQIIPEKIIDEIKIIFKLMPVHELYYIKVNEQEFSEYIERLNRLYIKVLDDYESYTEMVTSKYWKIIIIFVYLIVFLHKHIEKWFGFYAIPVVLGCLVIFWVYENRWKFSESLFNFLKQ